MLNLGIVRPGSTIRIPFSSFDKDDGSSITMTNYAAADILIYKDGNTTERASTSGFTATTDFDSKTGKHLAVIDLSDNTTADFYNAGSEYLVAIDAVTVDAVTTGGWIARFRIGHQDEWYSTTIATLSSQTSFTLTTGPAEDDALNGQWAIIHDIASAVQCARVLILDYTGSTKTVTLAAGGTFTAAAGDNISIMGMAPLQPATLGRTIVVDSAGLADANMVKAGPTGSGTAQTAGDIIGDTNDIQARLPAALVSGRMDSSTGAMAANVLTAAATAADFGAEIATAIWTDITAGDFTVAASIGKSIMNGVALGTGLTINAYTGNTVQTGDAYARLGAPAGASVSADIADLPTNAELATSQAAADDATLAAIAALNNLSAAAVNAEVVDALATDTYAEPGQGTPAATTSLAAKINYLYKALRNLKKTTATTFELYNDAGNVVDQKATLSDDGTTFTKTELESGP